jgi:transitional endoplasmic reticulum ATPase
MQLKVMDVPWNLIGRKKIIVNTNSKEFEAGEFVKVWKDGKITVATIQKNDQSGKNTIRLDKNLRENLSVEIGDTVQIEKSVSVNDAESIQVSIISNSELSSVKIKNLLNGLIVCEDNKEHFLENGVVIHILKTIPKGIVRVIQSTDIQMAPPRITFRNVLNSNRKPFGISLERPSIDYNDVGGLENIKKLLIENIVYAIEKVDLYKKIGYKPIKGMMLYGPPGTGKTLIAKATATESGANFIFVPSAKLKNKYYGESERKIREIFIKAKDNAPCIIFLDEIDAIAEERKDWKISLVNQLLVLMDEIADLNIFVISATNRINLIDDALLRPGRFTPIEVPLPDITAREQIFRVHLENSLIDEDGFKELASDTQDLTGAQIEDICNRAKMKAMIAMKFSPESKLEMKHLREVIRNLNKNKQDQGIYC